MQSVDTMMSSNSSQPWLIVKCNEIVFFCSHTPNKPITQSHPTRTEVHPPHPRIPINQSLQTNSHHHSPVTVIPHGKSWSQEDECLVWVARLSDAETCCRSHSCTDVQKHIVAFESGVQTSPCYTSRWRRYCRCEVSPMLHRSLVVCCPFLPAIHPFCVRGTVSITCSMFVAPRYDSISLPDESESLSNILTVVAIVLLLKTLTSLSMSIFLVIHCLSTTTVFSRILKTAVDLTRYS